MHQSSGLSSSYPLRFSEHLRSPSKEPTRATQLQLPDCLHRQHANCKLRLRPSLLLTGFHNFSQIMRFEAPLASYSTCESEIAIYCTSRIRGRSRRVSKASGGGCIRSSNETGPNSTSKEVGTSAKSTEELEQPSWSSSKPNAAAEAAEGARGGLGDFSLLQTRRFWLGTSVAVLVALGGNLAGVTSSIFNLNPELSRSVRADLLFPVKGFKRYLETAQGFEFLYPSSWVGDQRLLYRAVERAERERSLDLPPIQGRQPQKRTSQDPIVAFGPPGTNGELNVSVVVAPIYPGFTLQKIGGPQEAGELILKQFIAPEGSKKVATLLNAQQRLTGHQLYYTLEYTVKGSTFFRHNLAVYTTGSGLLYSLNAQSSESAWKSVQANFVEIANSFKLLL